jgi:two-component SAPR family response regulator
VIDSKYVAAVSPEYVHFEGETVWLDQELVTSRSREVRQLVEEAQRAGTEQIGAVLDAYTDRFALDFVYEDWATSYRDSLHASFLSAAERAIRQLAQSGRPDDAIHVARRTLAVDPSADQIELALLRLYRKTGANAAAAEQYAHYSSVLRDELGVDPPTLDEL